MTTKRTVTTMLIILAIILSACSAGEKGYRGKAAGVDIAIAPQIGASADNYPAYEVAERAVPASAPQPQPAHDRMVIRNASLSLTVKSPSTFASQLGKLATDMDGYVVSSYIWEREGREGTRYQNASVSIRVPADKLDQAMADIRSLAIDVQSEGVSGQDVTQEYIDLQARLNNLEAAEAQLVKIMEDARRTEDVISVFQQLTYYRGEIESVKGQLQYYEQSVRMSLISVEATDEPAEREITIGNWKPHGVAKEAIRTLIWTVQGLGNFVIWLALYLLPLSLIMLLVAVPAFKLARRIKQSRQMGRAIKNAETEPPSI